MENLFGGIYKGKKVLITGHTGFKGSWLALWLSKMGAEVIGYSLYIPSNPNHFELLNLNITSIEGDILDKEKISMVISEHKPDIIFHMAAQALVRKSYRNPVETFETNILGTINILEGVRLNNIKAVVNVTSDKCYQNLEDKKSFTEDDPMGGNDPYSASKGAVEIVSNSYRKSFFPTDGWGITHDTLLANARAGNVIGGGDWAEDRLIPDIIRATAENKIASIRNKDAVRPWQHVLEPLSGYLALGQKLLEKQKDFAANWNFGPTNESSITVEEVINYAKEDWSDIKVNFEPLKETVHEAKILNLNSSKANLQLKWKSVWKKERTISKTLNWYKEYYINKTLLSGKDIEDYIEDARKANLNWAK
jgi:CDP-glucose 4,6-dehydratase